MNYKECLDKIRDLGFSDDEDMEAFGELVPNSIDRAVKIISGKFPIYAKYEFEIRDEDKGYLYIDMSETVDGFLELRDTPVMYEQSIGENPRQMFTRFTDYEIEMGDTIVIRMDDYNGKFRIYYAKEPTRITIDTEDEFTFEIPLKAHELIPLLASYYIWLDDDATKAAQYMNLYEQDAETVTSVSDKPRARILRGGI